MDGLILKLKFQSFLAISFALCWCFPNYFRSCLDSTTKTTYKQQPTNNNKTRIFDRVIL